MPGISLAGRVDYEEERAVSKPAAGEIIKIMSLTLFTAQNEPMVATQSPTATLPGAIWRASGQPHFAALLARFAPIGLTEMSRVALLDRTDTKFMLSEEQLYDALSVLVDEYRVLDIHSRRLNRYRTLYFDTDDYALFRQHHDGRRHRYKVRARNYVDSRLSFLEVKRKFKRNRTIKERMPTAALLTCLTPEANDFLGNALPFAPTELEPTLWNEYTRITLVSKRDHERLTLDLNLRFSCYQAGRYLALPNVVIAELKQDGHNRNSSFIHQMRAWGIRPVNFSKYCAGMAMLCEGLRHNNFKPKLRLVDKLVRGECRE